MAKQKFVSTATLTPGKIALMGVLTVVFLVIVVVNFGGSSQPAAKKSPKRGPGSRQRPTRQSTAKKPTAAVKTYVVDERLWQQFKLDEITAFNPFDRPQTLGKEADPAKQQVEQAADDKLLEEQKRKAAQQLAQKRKREAFLRTLRTSSSLLILRTTGARRIAMIGDRRIRVGDVLPEGFRVTGINDTGLILDEVNVEATSQHGGSGNGENEQ